MKTKNTDHYFKVAQSIPLAVSVEKVRALVKLKGVSPPSSNNAWFNLNNFLMMSITTFIIAGLSYFLLTPNAEIAQKEIIKTDNTKSEITLEEKIPNNVVSNNTFKTTSKKVKPLEVSFNQDVLESQLKKSKIVGQRMAEGPIFESQIFTDSNSIFDTRNQKETLFEDEELNFAGTPPDMEVIDGNSITITRSLATKGIYLFVIDNNRGNINIKTADINEVIVEGKFSLKVDKEEFLDSALNDVALDFSVFGNQIELKNPLAQNCGCNVGSTWKQRREKKADGKKYKIEDFKISYEITMPKNLNLKVDNKYGDVNLQDLNANLEAIIFQGDIAAGDVNGEIDITLRYGDGSFKNFNNAEVELFKAKTNFGSGVNMDLNAKFSEVNIQKINDLEVSGFQSDFEIAGDLNTLSGDLKYGSMSLNGNAKDIDIKTFKMDLNCNNISKLNWEGSYSKMKGNTLEVAEINNAFQSGLDFEKVGMIKGSGKYSTFKIGELEDKLDLNTFKGEISVNTVKSSFTKIACESKYTNVDLGFVANSKYNLELETMYGSLNYPEANFEKKYESIINQTTTVKGIYNNAVANTDALVSINAFQGRINLK